MLLLEPQVTLQVIFASSTALHQPLDGVLSCQCACMQAYDQELWNWDVYICHAGEDTVLAQSLRDQLLPLRVLMCEDTPMVGDMALQPEEAAVRCAYVAVVLLCEELFREKGGFRF